SIPQRAVLAIGVLLGVLSVFVLMWSFEISSSYLAHIRAHRGHVPGVQGRYLIPLALPFLLMISSSRNTPNRTYIGIAVVFAIVPASLVMLCRVWSTNYRVDPTPPVKAAKAGIYRQGQWLIEVNPGQPRQLQFGGLPGDVPVPGAWL